MTEKTPNGTFSGRNRRGAIAIAVCLGLVALWGGLRSLAPAPPDGVEVVAGLGDIETGLARLAEASGVEDPSLTSIVEAGPGESDLDLLYIGTPECGHCRDFVSAPQDDPDGLAALAALARAQGLSFAYRPAALSVHGAAFAAIEACLDTKPSGPEGLQALYASFETYGDALAAAGDRPLADALLAVFRELGGADMACVSAAYDRELRVIGSLDAAFPGQGVPRFYVAARGGVFRIVGARDIVNRVSDLVE